MSDIVVDSRVVAKWVLPEPDADKALRLLTEARVAGDRLTVVEISLPEVANAIWKRRHRGLMPADEADRALGNLARFPLTLMASAPLIPDAFKIAVKYDRSVYDALFVALSRNLGVRGVTSDEPLFEAVRADYPNIQLLRHL